MAGPVSDKSGNGVVPEVGGGPSTEQHASGHIFAITPDNDNDRPSRVRGIYVGGTGSLRIQAVDGSIATFGAIPVGTIIPVQVKRVFVTGTTVTQLIGRG